MISIIVKLIVSILLAYPISGFIYALYVITFVPGANHNSAIMIGFFVLMWTALVPAAAGIVPLEFHDGPTMNMYPLIVPIAAVLFCCISKCWRVFERKA